MDAWAVWTYTGKLWRNGVDQLEALGTVWLEYRDLTTQAVQKGRSARPFSKAAGESKPEAYPLGYVEDFDEPRTMLAGFFNSLLGGGTCLYRLTTGNRASSSWRV